METLNSKYMFSFKRMRQPYTLIVSTFSLDLKLNFNSSTFIE